MTNNVPYVSSKVLERVCNIASEKANNAFTLNDVGLITIEERQKWENFTQDGRSKMNVVTKTYFILRDMALKPVGSVSIAEYQSSIKSEES
jgi:hypothetical protein